MQINAAIQLLPFGNDEEKYKIIDSAIQLIQESGLVHLVCPFETVDLNNAILGSPSSSGGSFEFHIALVYFVLYSVMRMSLSGQTNRTEQGQMDSWMEWRNFVQHNRFSCA